MVHGARVPRHVRTRPESIAATAAPCAVTSGLGGGRVPIGADFSGNELFQPTLKLTL
jgi:hypothetical protein